MIDQKDQVGIKISDLMIPEPKGLPRQSFDPEKDIEPDVWTALTAHLSILQSFEVDSEQGEMTEYFDTAFNALFLSAASPSAIRVVEGMRITDEKLADVTDEIERYVKRDYPYNALRFAAAIKLMYPQADGLMTDLEINAILAQIPSQLAELHNPGYNKTTWAEVMHNIISAKILRPSLDATTYFSDDDWKKVMEDYDSAREFEDRNVFPRQNSTQKFRRYALPFAKIVDSARFRNHPFMQGYSDLFLEEIDELKAEVMSGADFNSDYAARQLLEVGFILRTLAADDIRITNDGVQYNKGLPEPERPPELPAARKF